MDEIRISNKEMVVSNTALFMLIKIVFYFITSTVISYNFANTGFSPLVA